MTVAFSSSSPLASVALIDGDAVLASGERESHREAGKSLIEILDELLAKVGRDLSEASLFVSDVGPGSFTGVKVCVTVAKTMAFAHNLSCAGVTSFDLIDPRRPVAIPSKRGEFFVRNPGERPSVSSEVPVGAIGYGPGIETTFPHAKRALSQIPQLQRVPAESLVPLYVAEPSISQPKDRRVLGGQGA